MDARGALGPLENSPVMLLVTSGRRLVLWLIAAAVMVAGDAALFAYRYGIEPNSPASAAENALSSGSTLAIRHSLAETAARFHASEDAVRAVLETSRQRLIVATGWFRSHQ